jgi:hypothetical protein
MLHQVRIMNTSTRPLKMGTVLDLLVLPLALQIRARLIIVIGIVARSAQWYGGDQATANRLVEGIPLRCAGPATIARKALAGCRLDASSSC